MVFSTFMLSMRARCHCDQFVGNVSYALREVIFPLSLLMNCWHICYLWACFMVVSPHFSAHCCLAVGYFLQPESICLPPQAEWWYKPILCVTYSAMSAFYPQFTSCRSFLWKLPWVQSGFDSRSAPLIFRYEGSTFQDRWWSSGEKRVMIYSLISVATCREVWVTFICHVCRCSTPLVQQTIQYLYWHTCPLNTLIMFQHIFHFGPKAVVFSHTMLA